LMGSGRALTSSLALMGKRMCEKLFCHGLQDAPSDVAASFRIAIRWLSEGLGLLKNIEAAYHQPTFSEPLRSTQGDPLAESLANFQKSKDEWNSFEAAVRWE